MKQKTIRNANIDAACDSIRYDYFLDRRWHAARITLSAVAERHAHLYEPELLTFANHVEVIYRSTTRKARAQRSKAVVLYAGGDVRH